LKISAYLQADVMMGWKFKSDKALSERNAFRWVILRPGGFSDEPGIGKVAIGRTHLMPLIPVRFLHFSTVKTKIDDHL